MTGFLRDNKTWSRKVDVAPFGLLFWLRSRPFGELVKSGNHSSYSGLFLSRAEWPVRFNTAAISQDLFTSIYVTSRALLFIYCRMTAEPIRWELRQQNIWHDWHNSNFIPRNLKISKYCQHPENIWACREQPSCQVENPKKHFSIFFHNVPLPSEYIKIQLKSKIK